MPFVAVQYKGKTLRTSTAEGSNPTWNEQIVISARLVGDEYSEFSEQSATLFSSWTGSQSRMKDYLCLQMFDEQVEDLFDEDRLKANEIYQRVSSKWLAEIRIPFCTIHAMQRVSLKVDILRLRR